MGSQAAYKLPQDFEQAELEVAPEPDPAAAPVATPAPATPPRIRLWDLPVRVFHWSLVLAVTTAIVTAQLGGDWMPVHGKAGLTIVGLVTFRLVWGFIGSKPARFFSFAPTPGKIRAYLKGQWRGVGHNPLGAFSVFALLGLLAAQASTGLFSNDDIAFTGPLFDLVNEDLAGKLTGWHRQFATALYVLLGLHVAAIAFYMRIKKDNLVKPMVTGWKDLPADASVAAQKPAHASAIAFVFALAVALAAVYAATGAPLKKAPAATTSTSNTSDGASVGDNPGTEAGASTTATTAAPPTTSAGTKAAAPAW